MTTLTLHKLPEGFIITSDEKINKGDIAFETLNKVLFTVLEENDYSNSSFKKVIAQQDQIDFSALTEEEQKEIGWFNIYKLFQEDSFEVGVDGHSALTTYTAGFQKAQELLSDRRFTLEEVGELFQQIVRIIPEQELRKWTKESFVKHFAALQNRSWAIEVEMGEYSLNSDGEPIGFPDMSKPKFTNGKLKVSKIL